MKPLLRVAVLGAGNWGTTLAHLSGANGHRTCLWTRDPSQRDEINQQHSNARAQPELALSENVRAVCELSQAVEGTDLIVVAIPSQAFRDVCRELAKEVRPEHHVLHGTKGLEAQTHRRMSELLLEETCVRQFGVLAGPNIATEIARGRPAGTVIATRFPRVAALGQRAFSSPRLRVFDSQDVCGVELCGALKNVVAIAAGMADEMDVGDNAKAFLMTRGLAELMRLAFAMGAEPATTAGLAGIGDLMVTCQSPLSRNHRVGALLAQGVPLAEATRRIGMVAEGVYASRSARALASSHGIEMPLFEHIDRVLHEGLAVQLAIETLMDLPTGRDVPRVMARGS